MRCARNHMLHCGPEALDFFFTDRSPLAFASDKSKHTRSAKNFHTIFRCGRNVHERVAAEQRDIHFSLAVTPTVNLLDERQERTHLLFQEMCRNSLFMPRHCMNRIPLWTL